MSSSESTPRPLRQQSEVLEFASTNEPEAVKTVTEQASELNVQYETRRQSLENRILDLQEKIRTKSLDLDEVVGQKEILANALTIFETGLVGKVFNFLKIIEIKKKIGVHETQIEILQNEFDEVVALLGQMEMELDDRTELIRIDKLMSDFYSDQTEKLTAYEQDKEMRDVNNVAREHHAVFAHAFSFRPRTERGSVTVLKDEVGWKQKLDIVLGLSPELPTSTVRDEKPSDELYYGMGVLLKGGSIRSADIRDAGTTVSGGKRHDSGAVLTSEQIAQAIVRDSGYNELVVAEPQVAGFFIDANKRSDMTATEREAFMIDLKAKTDETNMPVYFRMRDGKFYHAVWEISPTNQGVEVASFSPGEPISAEKILANNFSLSDEQKRTAREGVFANCPFKINHPERRQIDAWNDAKKAVGKFRVTDDNNESEGDGRIRIGTSMLETENIFNVSDCVLAVSGLIAKKESEYLADRAGFEQKLASGDQTNQYGVSLEALKQSNDDSHKSKKQELAFFLYGLAEMAKKNGDEIGAEKALVVAEAIVPRASYDDVLARRLSPDGKFRITEEDLKNITSGD